MTSHPVSRREFLESTALGAAAVAVSSRPAAASPVSRLPSPGFSVPPFELEEVTIADLQAAMKSGKYTSVRLCQLYLARIQAMDKKRIE